MWARVVEAMLGVWLLLSPFIFHHPADEWGWWVNDLATGTLVIVLGLASYYRPLRHAHLLQLAVATWLIGFGYLAGSYPNPPALQNHIVLGLLLLLFGIIPNEASLPPESWRPHLTRDSS